MRRSLRNRQRGASELIGIVLLFAFVFAAATFTFYFGLQASDSIQRQNQMEAAETTMQDVQSRMSSLAASNDESVQRFELDRSAGDDVRVVSDGTISFRINDHPNCGASMGMGSIVYENDRGSVAYQAGGVWRKSVDGSTLVSPPGLSYDRETVNGQRIQSIVFPMVNVAGSIEGDASTLEARKNTTMTREAQRNLEEQLCLRGPHTDEISEDGAIKVENITIRVEGSTYYEAWGSYLKDEFGDATNVSVYDGNQTVVVRNAPLGAMGEEETDEPDEPHHTALYSTGNAGENTTLRFVEVDSFDSDEGVYADSQRSSGKFVIDGKLILDQKVDVAGDVVVDGDVEIDNANQIDVQGNLAYNGTVTGDVDDAVAGTVTDNATVAGAEPVTDEVVASVNHLSSGNHTNWRTTAIEEQAINDSGGEIRGGQYYVDDFELDDGQTLVLNTSEDDLIVVGVGEDFVVDSESELVVEGDGQVIFYVNDSVTVADGGTVDVEDDETWRNWLYCTASCEVAVEGPNSGSTPDTQFTGVVYAPTDPSNDDSEVTIDGSVGIYGALVGGELDFAGSSGDKPTFHFDEALLTTNPPEVTLGDTGDGPGGGGDDAIGGGDGDGGGAGDDPDGTLQTRENVTVDGTKWHLDSFDVVVELRGSELTGGGGGDLTFYPVEFDLLTDGSGTGTDYFPNEDPPPHAARDDDAAWPSLFYDGSDRQPQTALLEDLPGGTNFSVAAMSYYCSDFRDTGEDRTIDGSTYDLEGCTTETGERINIDASLDTNNGNLKILRDGDYLPNVDGALAGQLNYTQMLGDDRINDSGYLTLDDNEVVFLFELSDENAQFDAGNLTCAEYQCEAYYALDEDTRTVANEETGNANDGTIRDTTTVGVEGVNGSTAYEFDGDDDRVEFGPGAGSVADSLSGENFTINVWAKPSDSGVIASVQDGSDFKLQVYSDYSGTLYLYDSDGNYYEMDGGTLNQWHQITVTYNGSKVVGYVDGQRETSYTPDTDFSDVDRVWLGAEKGDSNPTYEFTGKVDEFKVFDSALTADQIDNTGRDAFFDGDPDYNDAVMLYTFEDFQWSCVENCSSPSEGGDGGDGSTDVDNSVENDVRDDDNGPQDNDYVIRITNSQVVVESDDDS